MNRLVIIGNGFDLNHNLKTSYESFILWYLNRSICSLFESDVIPGEEDGIHWYEWRVNDKLISLEIRQYYNQEYEAFGYPIHKEYDRYKKRANYKPLEFLSWLTDQYPGSFCEERSLLLNRIIQDMENKGWTDIESDYYELLKKNKYNIETTAGCVDIGARYELPDSIMKDINKYFDYITDNKHKLKFIPIKVYNLGFNQFYYIFKILQILMYNKLIIRRKASGKILFNYSNRLCKRRTTYRTRLYDFGSRCRSKI